MHYAIIVQNLGKSFNRYHSERPTTIMEAALKGLQRMRPVEQFWALRHISFEVAPGEMLGVIGHNGAGKSTLLQLIGGVGAPSEGRVKINGRIGALLDLGTSFHGDLTGRENVFVTAIIAGLTHREVARRFETIVEFAELENFIDNPVRTYSTGMQMRLAFSIAVHTEPELLLVDEFLSVGDLSFQSKCLERIAQLKAQGCAIVYISHSPEQIQKLCDKALWLRKGQVAAYGEPEVVTGQYLADMRSKTQQLTPLCPPQLIGTGVELQTHKNRFGSLEVEITDVRLLPENVIRTGTPLKIEISYLARKPIQSPIFSVSVSQEDGQTCFESSTTSTGVVLPPVLGEGQVTLELDRLDLTSGSYFVDVGVYEQNWSYAYDYHWHVYSLLIESEINQTGILNPPQKWKFRASPILSRRQ